MKTAAPISVDEYLRTTYDPDRDYVDGEVIERMGVNVLIAICKAIWSLTSESGGGFEDLCVCRTARPSLGNAIPHSRCLRLCRGRSAGSNLPHSAVHLRRNPFA